MIWRAVSVTPCRQSMKRVCSLTQSCSNHHPYRDIHPYVRQMYEAFGAERMFWGTDITRMPCTWRQCVTMFTEELPWLTDRDKEVTIGRALCEWLEWHPG
jgi:predicted TIM-barrel fold metal-dependent hydrolase